MIRNNTELDLVLPDVLPILEERVNRTDYVVIAWSKAGWVNVFSKERVLVPDDLRKQKLATNPETEKLNTVFKNMGFNLVETGVTDVGTRLMNGMINAVYQTPAAIFPVGLHKTLVNMLDLPIAPITGAIVMNRVTWNKLSSEQQRNILRVTKTMAVQFDAVMPRTVANAVSLMQKDGLSVNRPNSTQETLWRTEVQKAIPLLLGTTFDRDIYQRINDKLERTRKGQ